MKSLLFDLDDTLVSVSDEYRISLVNATTDSLGIARHTSPLELWYWHFDTKVHENLGTDIHTFWNTLSDINEGREEASIKATTPYPDVSLLKQFKEMGLKMAVVTGSPTERAWREIEVLYSAVGERVFDSIVIANKRCANVEFKPSPEGALIALKELKCKAEDSLFIGNGFEDVQCAKNAGVKSVLVERTQREKELEIEATYRVSGLGELKTLLKALG